jgi:hypothetical protein
MSATKLDQSNVNPALHGHPCSSYSLDEMPNHPKYLNDANHLRTIKVERRGRKYRVEVRNTNRALVSYKDHASLKAANAHVLALIARGSWA